MGPDPTRQDGATGPSRVPLPAACAARRSTIWLPDRIGRRKEVPPRQTTVSGG